MRCLFLGAGWLAVLCLSPAMSFAFSADLSSRITAAQDFWRESGAAYWGESVPLALNQAKTLQSKLQVLLDRLVYESPLRGYDIRAQIIADDSVNARTDGRTIFVHLGLIKAAGGREDILTAVMAHELGHILGHHAFQRRESSERSVIQAGLPFLNLNRYSAMVGPVLNSGVKMREASYSRHQEEEADAIASFLIAGAGYDPRILGAFVETIGPSNKVTSNLAPAMLTAAAGNFSNPASVLQNAALGVFEASPLYQTHPSSPLRQTILHRMAERKSGSINTYQLAQSSPWLAQVYETMERRRPKTDGR